MASFPCPCFRETRLLEQPLSITGPIALFTYFQTKKKEQQQREEGTYHSLDEKYLQYQELCLRYSGLDVFDYPSNNPRDLSDQEKKQELIMFTILVSLFERAFLMYRGHTEELREMQWE